MGIGSSPTLEQRLAARSRPDRAPVMLQSWRHLLFLHWRADADALGQVLPPGLHLDLFEGEAWLGIVPFFMRGVRPRGLPAVPGLSNFLELNVRTYVHDQDGRPGVWFFSLDASNAIACAVARARFHLPYFEATMRARAGEWVDYHCLRKKQVDPARYRYRAIGPARRADPGSLDFFLVERYDLYAHDPRSGHLFRGRVHHAPYVLHDAEVDRWSDQPLAWNTMPSPSGPPQHLCCAEEVKVEVFPLERHPGPDSDRSDP